MEQGIWRHFYNLGWHETIFVDLSSGTSSTIAEQ